MKKAFILFALVLPVCFPLAAVPIIQLAPGNGAITGTPGSVTGWGFTVQSDPTHWISFVGSFLVGETNPALGAYTDRIGVSGGPADFVLPAAALPWEQSFNEADQTGLAAFALSLAAATEETNSGVLRVQWTEYSADPLSCSSCFAGSFYQDFDFQVTVTRAPPEAVPEPATLSVVLIVGAVLLGRRVRQPRSCYLESPMEVRNRRSKKGR